ncbi:hypothetical protein [Thermomonas sp.]|uniref:hypothetical protein n=1 Tax=Thermomonas sp. TaxID=1971895 RepID=UPI0024893C19|nr:hypothetical protein [Thermomonas sp.]MDI1254120.1 hypothetical protein [Thermomonas sp.]
MATENVALKQATIDIGRISALLDGVQCIVDGFIEFRDITVARQAFVASTTIGQASSELSEIARKLNLQARVSASEEVQA